MLMIMIYVPIALNVKLWKHSSTNNLQLYESVFIVVQDFRGREPSSEALLRHHNFLDISCEMLSVFNIAQALS